MDTNAINAYAGEGGDQTVEEVAWKTAVDAAPWLVGSQPTEGVDSD